MCKCKKILNHTSLSGNGKSGSNVVISVNVTQIVKYVALAGVAIVGIIFGTGTWLQYQRSKEEKEA